MKKGIFKKSMATLIAISMIVGSSTMAYASSGIGTSTDTGVITGTSILDPVVYDVLLPVNLNFAFDAYGAEFGGITTVDFPVVNGSGVNVAVSFDLTATFLNGSTFAPEASITPDAISGAPKSAYFAVMVSDSTAAVNDLEAPTAVVANYNPAVSASRVSFVPAADNESATASVSFVLEKSTLDTSGGATDGDFVTLPDGPGSDKKVGTNAATAFKFYGQYNTYATGWAAGDITFSGAYTLKALTPSTIANSNINTTTAHRLLLPGSGFQAASYAVTRGGTTTLSTLTGGVLDFNFKSAAATATGKADATSVTSIQVYTADGSTLVKTLTAADYTLDVAKGTITLKGGASTASFGSGVAATTVQPGNNGTPNSYKIVVTIPASGTGGTAKTYSTTLEYDKE